MQVEVTTPEDHMGDVIGDLNSRRGLVGEFLDKPGNMRVSTSPFLSQAGCQASGAPWVVPSMRWLTRSFAYSKAVCVPSSASSRSLCVL